MVISEKQHQANLQNAQKSTGPVTASGKAYVRHNAVTHGLRSRSILKWEDPNVYADLWEDFEHDFQPQTRAEWCYLETMVTSQWLLARIAARERIIYEKESLDETLYRLLDLIQKQRVQLERSFRTAIADMKQSLKERQTQPQPKTEPVRQNATPETEKPVASPPPAPSQPPVPPPAYVMSEPAGIHPVVCAPAANDSR